MVSNIVSLLLRIDYNILIDILKRKIKDKQMINLIKLVLINGKYKEGRGMPLGNLTSQFFANLYLNDLDYFVKHKLRVKYYIRYVDDFIILHNSKEQLIIWKEQINNFLKEELRLELYPDKSKIIPLSKGIDFLGFRNFYYHKSLRKRNIIYILSKLKEYNEKKLNIVKIKEIFQG